MYSYVLVRDYITNNFNFNWPLQTNIAIHKCLPSAYAAGSRAMRPSRPNTLRIHIPNATAPAAAAPITTRCIVLSRERREWH